MVASSSCACLESCWDARLIAKVNPASWLKGKRGIIRKRGDEMKQNMKLHVLSVERFDFLNEKGEQVLMGRLTALGDYESSKGRVGCPPMLFSCSPELIDDVRELHFPAEYDVVISVRSGGKSRGVMFAESLAELPGGASNRKPAA